MEQQYMPCAKNDCPKIATDEVRYLLRQTPNSTPIESPVMHLLCSDHAAEIEWGMVYCEEDWVGMQKNYVSKGYLPPLVQLSWLEIRPMKK